MNDDSNCRNQAIKAGISAIPSPNVQMYLISMAHPCCKISSGDSKTVANHPTQNRAAIAIPFMAEM
jgi:hypothetical protein